MAQSKVAIMKTSPKTVVPDYGRLMDMAEYRSTIPIDSRLLLKLNLSWTLFYPACSSPPWQVEGVVSKLRSDGYKDVTAVENKTVVTKPVEGARLNKWLPVLDKYDVEFLPLPNVEWVEYKPKHDLMALDSKVFSKIIIPKMFIGSSIMHFPTQKTHGHSTMTGALKNAFGGLLREARHHCHTYIHEVLVDLLTIQQEIHKGIFAVMDGTVTGNGAGPRTMIPEIKNYILASSDQVAIDAVSAKMMGFDPMEIPKIRLSHDKGLGCGDVDQIDIIGEDISNVNYHFHTKRSIVIWGDQMVRKGDLRFLEPLMHTNLFFIPQTLSMLYHDKLWYPTTGKKYIREFMKTEWGEKFLNY